MALEIFKLVGSVFVDTDQAEKSLKKTDKSAEGFGSKLLAAGKTAGKFALGVGAAVGAAGAAVVALTENTREYRTEQGKLETAFTQAGHSAEAARQTYSELNGVLGDSGQAVEAASHIAKLVDAGGDLEAITGSLTGVYATFGDSLPVEGLAEAMNHTAKLGEVQGPLADALEWSGVSTEEFNKRLAECTTEGERTALITEQMVDLYWDAGEAYKEINADVIAANEAQDRINAAMAAAGGALEPFVTKGKELIAEVLERLTPALEWLANTALPWVSNAVSGLSAWFGDLIGKVGESGITFDSIMTWIKDAFSVAVQFIQEYWEAYGKPVWDFIKLAVQLVADYFKERMPQIKQFVQDCFTDIQNLWTNHLQPALKAVGDFINNVLAPAFKWVFENVITPVVDNAFRGIKDLWTNSLKPILEGICDFISGVFSGNFGKAWEGVVSILEGIWGGIVTVIKTPINAVIDLINGFLESINGLKIPDWVPGMGGTGVFNIDPIPRLASGGVLEQGQVGLLEGSGAEAVVPLHNNRRWINAVANDMDAALGGSGQTVELLKTMIDLQERTLKVMSKGQRIVLNERELGRTVRSLA